MEGLTVEGQMRHDRYEAVNFERERRKIFKLYRRTNVLQRRRALEQRIMQSFGLFCREALQDIRFLPRNPFTEWLEIDRQKTDFHITVLNVTIDDIDLIDDPFFPHFESMIERFERTYAHLKLEFPWFFHDYHDDVLDQIHSGSDKFQIVIKKKVL